MPTLHIQIRIAGEKIEARTRRYNNNKKKTSTLKMRKTEKIKRHERSGDNFEIAAHVKNV